MTVPKNPPMAPAAVPMGAARLRASLFCPKRFHAFEIANQLHRHGALVTLGTSYYGRAGKRANNRGISIPRAQVRTNPVLAGLFYLPNPLGELTRWDLFGRWAGRQLTEENVVMSFGLAAQPLFRAAKKRGALTVLHRGSAHAACQYRILREEFQRFGADTAQLDRSFNAARMERELAEYAEADFIEVPSSFAARSFVAEGVPAGKMVRGFVGVDLSQFSPRPRRDDVFRVVYVGRLELRKGVQYLLEAFQTLKLPHAELWLIGGAQPEFEPILRRFAGVARVFGVRPKAELPDLLSQCTVFAIASIEEGMATVQPQAMACGLPVICTTNTGGDDIITDGREGYVLPIRDVSALRERIRFLYENRAECTRMGEAALARVSRGLTWDDYGRKAVATYGQVLPTRCNA